jgi:ABC-type transport system involved in cytochrome c biogenesis permease component
LLLGNVWRSVDPGPAAGATPSIGKVVAEMVRTLVITYVLARLIALLGDGNWKSAVSLALWLWFGFSAMMWVGAIMWEETPWLIAAIHSGDWLLKTLLIAAIIGMWRGKKVVVAH